MHPWLTKVYSRTTSIKFSFLSINNVATIHRIERTVQFVLALQWWQSLSKKSYFQRELLLWLCWGEPNVTVVLFQLESQLQTNISFEGNGIFVILGYTLLQARSKPVTRSWCAQQSSIWCCQPFFQKCNSYKLLIYRS